MNKSIIYWKWDTENLNPAILDKKIEDLTSRTQITNICLGMQWITQCYGDEVFSAALRHCIDGLHAKGRKAMLECCIRNEGESFYRKYPGEPAYLGSFVNAKADQNGRGETVIDAVPVWHYWRVAGNKGEHKLIAAYNVRLVSPSEYEGTPVPFENNVKTSIVREGEAYKIRISFENALPDSDVICFVGFPQPLADLAHPKLYEYFENMAKIAAELGADGLFSDEWGYDMILKIVEVNPYDDKQLNLRHLSWSEHFEDFYRKVNGESLRDKLLLLCYAPAGQEKRREETIDNYIRALRMLCTENDEQMYAITKKELGRDAFWGVHPTWWGSVDSLNFEIFKNGFYWWDARRDYAQTDEMVLYAIRTALAHRMHSPLWYNMWYSMGTRDINTYFFETYTNLRYQGRTHYLGYECPNEAVVLEFKPEGLMEKIEEMDKRVRLLDDFSTSQPDCRLLVLFGFEDVTNWAGIGKPLPPWLPQNKKLDYVLNTTNEIFYKILCDLVPSYAAENGSLHAENGKAVYGTQKYDAVLVLCPDRMKKCATEFLQKLDASSVAVAADEPDEEMQKLIGAGAKQFRSRESSATLAAYFLNDKKIFSGRYGGGVRMQDGSVIFSPDAKLPAHNPLHIDTEIEGRRVQFDGEDLLYLSRDLKTAVYPAGTLTIDGKKLTSCRELEK